MIIKNPLTSVKIDGYSVNSIKLSDGTQELQIKGVNKFSLQSKTATPTTQNQTITFDSGYDGLSEVQVKAVTSAIDSNIIPANIRTGVSILGVAGTLEPDKPDQSKTVAPTTSSQTITADTGYELASVTINPVTSAIDSNITAENIKKDVTILGVTGTLESGGGGTPEPTPTSSAFFTFDGANITGYNGSDKNIILPKTYSKEVTIETLEGLWCPREEYSNWFYRVRDMQEMEFFYNGKYFNVYDSSVFDNLYSELEMRFPQGCYLTRARAGIYYAFEFLRQVNSSVNINGQSFANGTSAFDYIMQNSILDVNFAGDVEVVKYIDGTDYEVTGIASNAFEGNTIIKTVNVLGNILNIQESAFHSCRSLESVTLGNGVTSIGNWAFTWCSSLKSITIPDSVTSIGGRAFSECSSLTSITIPNSVTSIGNSTFDNCSKLTSITIPDSVTSIGSTAFVGCTALSLIIMSDGVMNIGSGAFQKLNAISVYVKDLEKWCSISFGDSESNPISNGGYLYFNYDLVKELTIPDTLTQIKPHSFYKYAHLTSIVIPDSVTSIGDTSFKGCSSLTSITVGNGNTKYKSEGNCLIEKATNELIKGCNTSVIPDGVTSIRGWAFEDYHKLKSITIPNSVTSIGRSAFLYCDGLTSVTIGNGVISISAYVFNGCTSLTEMTILATTPPTLADTDAISSATTKIYIPKGTLSAYRSATNWSNFASKFVELS